MFGPARPPALDKKSWPRFLPTASRFLWFSIGGCMVALYRRIVLVKWCQNADSAHPLRLLRARCERPSSHAAEQRDELATAAHSITSSARAGSVGGTSRPSALAVLTLITNSNLVGA